MKKKINWKTTSVALLVLLISFVIILLIDKFWTIENVWKAPVLAFIGAIQTTVLAVAVWDFIAKKEFAKDILDLAKISTNITESGIIYYYDNFLNIKWNDILKKASRLTIAVLYSNTWRESNRTYLAKLAESKDSLTVYLPNYKENQVLEELSCRLNMTVEEVCENIQKSEKGFKELGANVLLHNGSFQTSYYLTENEAVLAVFNHKREKSTVPAMQVDKEGNLYNFIKQELEAIKNNMGILLTQAG